MADDFSPQIATLAAGVPVVLLPVRLEARFFNGGDELRIRIFPDQVHADAHEPELTAAERDAGMTYWQAVFASPDAATRTTTPWADLCSIVGAPRAAWIARVLTPTNAAARGPSTAPDFPTVTLRTGEWGRAARAAVLPKRWLVTGLTQEPDALDPPTAMRLYEKFRKWSNEISPTLDLTIAPDAAPATDGATLPLQPTAKWLADFDEAERVGMAIRITAADCPNGQSPKDGIKRLNVVGVDWTQTPDDSAAALRQLMCSHVYTDGLSAIEPGTPTNATAAARAGAAPTSDRWVAALDPERRPAAGAVAGGASDRLWRDLGIVPTADDLLTAYPGANSSDPLVTSQLVNALWEGTLGAFAVTAMRTLVNDTTLADLRDHARKYLQPAGAYPTLRIGRQPYGVLPVVAGRTTTAAATTIETQLLRWTNSLEAIWRSSATDRVPRLGRSSNVDADLTSLLQRVPVSGTYQYRAVVDRVWESATAAQLTAFANAQDSVNSLLWTYLGSTAQTVPMTGLTVHPTATRLGVPLVDPHPGAPGTQLSTNYLQSIADLARSDGTFAGIKAREAAGSVLEALVANAVARELHRADMRTINGYLVAIKSIPAMPPLGILHVDPSWFGAGPPPPVVGTSVQLVNASQASRVVIPTVTGTKTVRQFVTAGIARGATVPPDFAVLNDTLASVEWLAGQPADQLERCLRTVLDGFSFRLDAWITSLAARRLATARATAPTGVYVGGYGWLDDLHPSTGATSLGYIHTPSLAHAATAAVLRSGHLAHHDAEHEAFDVDLSADRVRAALQILDAVAQGQPLAAVLGYQFERAVRSTSLLLAQYILPFRREVPLRSSDTSGAAATNPATPATASDTIAARDVVDGVALVERWRNERVKLFYALVPRPNDADQAVLGALLDALAGTYDAVADVMVAEAVHQNVLGNGERAGAVLAALDRQETPPRMAFVQTPRTGKSFTHRVLLLIGDESLPPSWSAIPLDARAGAEPRLNAWIARLIGDPARFALAATVSGGDGTSGTTPATASLVGLGLSPLSLVMAAEAPGKDLPSELDERVLHAIAATVAAPTATTAITLLDEAPSGAAPNVIGLGALRSLLRWIYRLVTTQRPATANDLSLPQDGNDEGFIATELAARADAVVAAHAAVMATLDGLVAAAPADSTSVRDALWGAASLGVSAAIPAAPVGVGADGDRLVAQVRGVAAEMHTAAARQDALVATFGAGTSATPRDLAAHHVDRIRALLGEHFPVLPRFAARNAPELAASLGDRATLCAGDDLAPTSWLQRMAFVRPGAGALSRVLLGSEMLQSGIWPTDLLVAQLPRAAGEPWLALRFGSNIPEAELSIAMASSGVVDFTRPLAGLSCDAWSEVVPSRTETTGLTFHYDAPDARPPQALLIAVPPEPPNSGWTVNNLLESVMEARRLAPLRAVTPADLRWMGTTLPPIWLPSSTSLDAAAMNLSGAVAPKPPIPPIGRLPNVLGKVDA